MLPYWVAFTTCLTLQHYIALECVQSILKILPMPVKEFFYVYHCFIHLYTFYTNISQPNKNNILSYLTFFLYISMIIVFAIFVFVYLHVDLTGCFIVLQDFNQSAR